MCLKNAKYVYFGQILSTNKDDKYYLRGYSGYYYFQFCIS